MAVLLNPLPVHALAPPSAFSSSQEEQAGKAGQALSDTESVRDHWLALIRKLDPAGTSATTDPFRRFEKLFRDRVEAVSGFPLAKTRLPLVQRVLEEMADGMPGMRIEVDGNFLHCELLSRDFYVRFDRKLKNPQDHFRWAPGPGADLDAWIDFILSIRSRKPPWPLIPKPVRRAVVERLAQHFGIPAGDLRTAHFQQRVAFFGNRSLRTLLISYTDEETHVKRQGTQARALDRLKRDLDLLQHDWDIHETHQAIALGLDVAWEELPVETKLLLAENLARQLRKPVGDLGVEDLKKPLRTMKRNLYDAFWAATDTGDAGNALVALKKEIAALGPYHVRRSGRKALLYDELHFPPKSHEDPDGWIAFLKIFPEKRQRWDFVPEPVARGLVLRLAEGLGMDPRDLRLRHFYTRLPALGDLTLNGLLVRDSGGPRVHERDVDLFKHKHGWLPWGIVEVQDALLKGTEVPWKEVPSLTKILLLENLARGLGKHAAALLPEDLKVPMPALSGISLAGILEAYAPGDPTKGLRLLREELAAQGNYHLPAGAMRAKVITRLVWTPKTETDLGAWLHFLGKRPYGEWPWSLLPKAVRRDLVLKLARVVKVSPAELTVRHFRQKLDFLEDSTLTPLLLSYVERNGSGTKALLLLKQELGFLQWDVFTVAQALIHDVGVPWRSQPPITKLILTENVARTASKRVAELMPEDFRQALPTLSGVHVEGLLHSYGQGNGLANLKALREEISLVQIDPWDEQWQSKLSERRIPWTGLPQVVHRATLDRIGRERTKPVPEWGAGDFVSRDNYIGKDLSGMFATYTPGRRSYREARQALLWILYEKRISLEQPPRPAWQPRFHDWQIVEVLVPDRLLHPKRAESLNFGRQLSSFRKLEASEIEALSLEIQKGNGAAQQALAEGIADIALRLARYYASRRTLRLGEARVEAFRAAMLAASLCDPDQAAAFRGYASRYIQGKLRQMEIQKEAYHAGVSAYLGEYIRPYRRLVRVLGRRPDPEEIVVRLRHRRHPLSMRSAEKLANAMRSRVRVGLTPRMREDDMDLDRVKLEDAFVTPPPANGFPRLDDPWVGDLVDELEGLSGIDGKDWKIFMIRTGAVVSEDLNTITGPSVGTLFNTSRGHVAAVVKKISGLLQRDDVLRGLLFDYFSNGSAEAMRHAPTPSGELGTSL